MASIRKRGSNSYLIVVSRGYDYEGNRLKSVQKTVKPPKEYTPKQAEKWVKEQAILFEREVQHTPEPINRSITLAKYIEHWVTDIGPKKLADSTYQRDLQDIRRILPALGNYKLTDLRKEVIRDFYEEMRHSPRLDGRGNLSEKSVEGLHNTLCGILSAAVDEGYLTHNPAWRCYKPKGQKKERPVADEETVKKLITAFEGQSMKYETYFKLVLATGLRRGEACGLKWSDINWRKRTIHVQRGVVKLSHQESITKDPKTASGDRMVYLSKEMCQLLKAWRKECEWDRAQTANETVNEDDYLFRQPNGKPMNPCTFTYRFKLILKANNLPLDLSVHSLRHPYVKHTTKIFSLRLMAFQAQAYPDARRKNRGACQLHRGGQSRSPVRPLCNRKRFSCLPPQAKMSWILYAISMRLSDRRLAACGRGFCSRSGWKPECGENRPRNGRFCLQRTGCAISAGEGKICAPQIRANDISGEENHAR